MKSFMETGTAKSVQGTFYNIMYCWRSLFSVSVSMYGGGFVLLGMKIWASLFMCENWNMMHFVIIGNDQKGISKE